MALNLMAHDVGLTSWADCKQSGIAGKVEWRKTGHIVEVHIQVTGLTTASYSTVGTLPAGVRPDDYVYTVGITAYNTNNRATVVITAEGDIRVYPVSPQTTCYHNVMFTV